MAWAISPVLSMLCMKARPLNALIKVISRSDNHYQWRKKIFLNRGITSFLKRLGEWATPPPILTLVIVRVMHAVI